MSLLHKTLKIIHPIELRKAPPNITELKICKADNFQISILVAVPQKFLMAGERGTPCALLILYGFV